MRTIRSHPNHHKPMASITVPFSRLNAQQLIYLADLVIPSLAPAAPATPPLPNLATKVAALVVKRTAAKTASDAYEAAKAQLITLRNARDGAADELRDEHKVVIAGVESEARGDATKLSSSKYPLESTTTQPTTVPAVIHNATITAGDADGTLDVNYNPERNSKTYEVQLTSADPLAGLWVTKSQPTTSSLRLTSLTSGQRAWVRVRGNGSKGSGGWRDPATKIVP